MPGTGTVHPNFMNHAAMSGGGARAIRAEIEDDPGPIEQLQGFVDRRVPRTVAAMVVGAALALFLLRAAGFRFSMGVGVGG